MAGGDGALVVRQQPHLGLPGQGSVIGRGPARRTRRIDQARGARPAPAPDFARPRCTAGTRRDGSRPSGREGPLPDREVDQESQHGDGQDHADSDASGVLRCTRRPASSGGALVGHPITGQTAPYSVLRTPDSVPGWSSRTPSDAPHGRKGPELLHFGTRLTRRRAGPIVSHHRVRGRIVR